MYMQIKVLRCFIKNTWADKSKTKIRVSLGLGEAQTMKLSMRMSMRITKLAKHNTGKNHENWFDMFI